MKKIFTVFIIIICGFLLCFLFTNSVNASVSKNEFFELCRTGSLEQIEDAILSGANVNSRTDDFDNTPIMVAAGYNPDSNVVTALIDAGAIVSRKNYSDETPLMHAAGRNLNKNAIKAVLHALVEAGDEINAKDKGGKTPLMWAVKSANLEAVIILLSLGADAKERDRYGTSPLDAAESKKEFRNTDAVRKLREASN